MRSGALTPEELDVLFEDAFVLQDSGALAQLFEDGAVLLAGGRDEARGGAHIAQLAAAMWRRRRTYVAAPRRVLQARDTALLLAPRSTSVARRGSDGWWRYAISAVTFEHNTEREER